MNRFITNVARLPRQMFNTVRERPAMLADEDIATVESVAKIWAREGLSDELLQLIENGSGIPAEAKRIIRHVALRNTHRVTH